jgi:hypothetical protein
MPLHPQSRAVLRAVDVRRARRQRDVAGAHIHAKRTATRPEKSRDVSQPFATSGDVGLTGR